MEEYNRRKFNRHKLSYNLQVFRRDPYRFFGYLIELSMGGGTIFTNLPISVREQLIISIVLPDDIFLENSFEIGVEILSSRPSELSRNSYKVGFRFVNTYHEHLEIIESIIEEYSYAKDFELLLNIQARLPELSDLLEELNTSFLNEDLFSDLYCQSAHLQEGGKKIKKVLDYLSLISPSEQQFCNNFLEIVPINALNRIPESTEHNPLAPRRLIEAFLHAKFFLETAVKYGRVLSTPPTPPPSGWAALLALYDVKPNGNVTV